MGYEAALADYETFDFTTGPDPAGLPRGFRPRGHHHPRDSRPAPAGPAPSPTGSRRRDDRLPARACSARRASRSAVAMRWPRCSARSASAASSTSGGRRRRAPSSSGCARSPARPTPNAAARASARSACASPAACAGHDDRAVGGGAGALAALHADGRGLGEAGRGFRRLARPRSPAPRRRLAAEDLSMIGLRFKSDMPGPRRPLRDLPREFGDRFEAIELEDEDAAPAPHSAALGADPAPEARRPDQGRRAAGHRVLQATGDAQRHVSDAPMRSGRWTPPPAGPRSPPFPAFGASDPRPRLKRAHAMKRPSPRRARSAPTAPASASCAPAS